MLDKLHHALAILKHYILIFFKRNHYTPYISDLVETCFDQEKKYYAFDKINRLRKRYHQSTQTIDDHDHGAKSKSAFGSSQTISRLYKSSSISYKQGEILFRIVNYSNSQHIIELGTCLGVGTLYLASSNQKAKVFTFEGNSQRARIAKNTFVKNGYKNIHLIEGNIDNTLSSHLKKHSKVDFVYLDANHTYEATINYFKTILPYCHEHTILIFDDIFWSRDMTKAWKEIIAQPSISASLNNRQIGIVFFNKNFQKKHYLIA